MSDKKTQIDGVTADGCYIEGFLLGEKFTIYDEGGHTEAQAEFTAKAINNHNAMFQCLLKIAARELPDGEKLSPVCMSNLARAVVAKVLES